MLITALQKNTRQSSRKVLLVANSVKKMTLGHALQQLSVMQKRASIVIAKVIRQAMANAIHNHGFKAEDLILKDILVNDGPSYKRFRAVSRGRAHSILKRTSHIKVILATKDTASDAAALAASKQAKPKVVTEVAKAEGEQSMIGSEVKKQNASNLAPVKKIGARSQAAVVAKKQAIGRKKV